MKKLLKLFIIIFTVIIFLNSHSLVHAYNYGWLRIEAYDNTGGSNCQEIQVVTYDTGNISSPMAVDQIKVVVTDNKGYNQTFTSSSGVSSFDKSCVSQQYADVSYKITVTKSGYGAVDEWIDYDTSSGSGSPSYAKVVARIYMNSSTQSVYGVSPINDTVLTSPTISRTYWAKRSPNSSSSNIYYEWDNGINYDPNNNGSCGTSIYGGGDVNPSPALALSASGGNVSLPDYTISSPLDGRYCWSTPDFLDQNPPHVYDILTPNDSYYWGGESDWYFFKLGTDLLAQSVSATGTFSQGATVTLKGTIKNNSGSITAHASTAQFQVDINNGGSWTSVGTASVPQLSPGGTQAVSANWANIPAGTHTVKLCADYTNALVDADTSNNCSTYQFTVSGPTPTPTNTPTPTPVASTPTPTPTLTPTPTPTATPIPTSTPTPTPTPTNTPTPTPTPVYSIQGTIFVDQDGDHKLDGSDQPYTAANTSFTLTRLSDNSTTPYTSTNGNYSFTNVPAGDYQITVNPPVPSGYFQYPTTGGNKVTLPCTNTNSDIADPSTGGICSGSGDVTTLNFALLQFKPWWQTIGSDLRIDSGIDDPLPTNFVASPDGSSGTPGILFSGGTNAAFDKGTASSTNWVVGNSTFPAQYSHQGSLKSSFELMTATLKTSGATINDPFPSICSPATNNCTLDNTTDGIYATAPNTNITISSGNVANNHKVVLLVDGTVQITGNVSVAAGSYLMVIAKGDLSVASTVGTAPTNSTTSQLDGTYVSDHNIIIMGNNDCSSGEDLMLVVGGAFIANAARNGGTFSSQRNLCSDNATYPAIKFTERPDFILNAPSAIQTTANFWKEVAP